MGTKTPIYDYVCDCGYDFCDYPEGTAMLVRKLALRDGAVKVDCPGCRKQLLFYSDGRIESFKHRVLRFPQLHY